jgi:nitrate reductase gamma subunit
MEVARDDGVTYPLPPPMELFYYPGVDVLTDVFWTWHCYMMMFLLLLMRRYLHSYRTLCRPSSAFLYLLLLPLLQSGLWGRCARGYMAKATMVNQEQHILTYVWRVPTLQEKFSHNLS